MSLNTNVLRAVDVRDKLLFKALTKHIEFGDLVGIDIQDPDLKWLSASYLPQYRKQRELATELYFQLKKEGQKFRFIKTDMLQLKSCPELHQGTFDVVWMSNTCYQIEGDPIRVEDNIRWLLKPNGVWLYAYYRYGEATIDNPYVVTLYPKKDWYHLIEVLESSDDEVRFLKRGRDFDDFYSDFTR
jgi:SAM-dependent methyltransferase